MNKAFANYSEFKTLFGIAEHGNGEKSRRNKILLSLFKSKEILRYMATHSETDEGYINYYAIDSMSKLYNSFMEWLQKESYQYRNRLYINGLEDVWSDLYKSDDFEGICEDGDVRSIRYVNAERNRVFKMKAGKFLRKLIEENENLNNILPEPVKVWVCEEFAENWKAYAAEHICKDEYELHVNDNFSDIYDPDCLKGDFGSCMVGDGFWTFYRDSVSAKAAYLTDNEGMIVARCIIYTDVIDENGKHLRLAERQYASDKDESLKRMLVMRLIDGNYIDGYKKVGADCHSPKAFMDVMGNPLQNSYLKITCDLTNYDTVSYQDSFKWYDEELDVAFNYGDSDEGNLSVTNGEREYEDNHDDDCWSEYNQVYIPSDDAYYVESRDDYFYGSQIVDAYRYCNGWYRETCFEEDCIEIDDEYYYAGYDCEDWYENGIRRCPECGEYFVPERENAEYSELTGEWYCDEDCRLDAEETYRDENDCRYDELDADWYDAKKEVSVRILVWDYETKKRVNGYTKRYNTACYRGNLVLYKGNWYYGNIDKSAEMPIEQMQKTLDDAA